RSRRTKPATRYDSITASPIIPRSTSVTRSRPRLAFAHPGMTSTATRVSIATRGKSSEDYSPEFAIKTGESYAGSIGLPHLTQGGIPLFLLSQDGSTYSAASNGGSGADIGSAASTNN